MSRCLEFCSSRSTGNNVWLGAKNNDATDVIVLVRGSRPTVPGRPGRICTHCFTASGPPCSGSTGAETQQPDPSLAGPPKRAGGLGSGVSRFPRSRQQGHDRSRSPVTHSAWPSTAFMPTFLAQTPRVVGMTSRCHDGSVPGGAAATSSKHHYLT